MNEDTMKKEQPKDPDMREEYDFSNASPVRGKYAARYAKGSNVVVIAPDVSKVFPNEASVNQALRALAKIIKDRDAAASSLR
jgi:hypothetical protein